MGETSFPQPADRRHRAGNALRQQPAQPPSGNMGSRHSVLHQAGFENRHCPVRIQTDFSKCHRHRRLRPGARPYCGHSHHSSGSRAGAPAENGQGHGPADLHRQFHLRGSSRFGGGTRRQKQTLQSRCGRFHRGHLRHALHVSVSSPAPGRNTGSDAGTNGAFYRSHPS